MLMTLAIVLLSGVSQSTHLRIIVANNGEEPVAGATVVAEPLGQLGSSAAIAKRVPAVLGSGIQLDLAPGIWRITAEAPRKWSWPLQITVNAHDQEPSEATLELLDAGRIAGSVKVEPPERPPSEISLILRQGFGPHSKSGDRNATTTCPVVTGHWECEAPAGIPLDLQVSAAGFAPRYLWGIKTVKGGTVPTGPLLFVRGASVTGWTAPSETSAKRAAVVRLTTPDSGTLEDTAELRFSAIANERHFFQIGPVPPGAYHVTATAAPDVSDAIPVHLVGDKEERIALPLVLKPPATLRLAVDPPRDAKDRPWIVRVVTRHGQHGGHLIVRGEPTSDDGTWAKSRLPAGRYQIVIMTEDGDRWHDSVVEVQPGQDEQQHLTFRMLRISGTVSIGNAPLKARVRLSHDRKAVTFDSDEGGDFSGYFPSVDFDSGDWIAVVESLKPRVKRTLSSVHPERRSEVEARVEIALPGGALRGTVRDERGLPQAAAVYADLLADDPAIRDSAAHTDPVSGKFEIPGLEAGEYQIYARSLRQASDEEMSDTVSVRIERKDANATANLIIRPSTKIEGRLLSAPEVGVPGATIFVFDADAPNVPVKPRTTDANGRFVARIPANTRNLLLRASAIGVGYRILGRPVPADGILNIDLTAHGGTLVVESQEPLDTSDVHLYHDQGWDVLFALAHWASANGNVEQGGVLRLPLMSPGMYRVCRVRDTEIPAFTAGVLPQGRCSEGFLPAEGALRVNLPAPLPKAQGTAQSKP